MNSSTITAAIKTVLSTIAVRIDDFVPDTVSSATMVVYDVEGDFNQDFEGTTAPTFIIKLFVPSVNTEGGQQKLNTLIESVRTTLAANPTLAGTVQSALCRRYRNKIPTLMPDGSRFYSVELVVDVYA